MKPFITLFAFILLGSLSLQGQNNQTSEPEAETQAEASKQEVSSSSAAVGSDKEDAASTAEVVEEEVAELDSGNTAWMITATALVLFMTLPGLALFYGGLVQSKNVLSVLMHCFAIAGTIITPITGSAIVRNQSKL